MIDLLLLLFMMMPLPLMLPDLSSSNQIFIPFLAAVAVGAHSAPTCLRPDFIFDGHALVHISSQQCKSENLTKKNCEKGEGAQKKLNSGE